MKRMSAQESSVAVDMVWAGRGSRKVGFLSQYLLYFLITFKNNVQNNKTAIVNS